MSTSVKTDKWPGGIDNLAPAGRTPAGFVRDAVNVDPTPGGELHLRTGYELTLALADCRGVLALGDNLLIAAGTDLIEYDTRSASSRVLRSIAGAGQFIGDDLDGVLYFFTANEALEYDGERVRTWGVPDVLQQPLPTLGAGGGLLAGQYKLAVTFSDADGREGGTDAPLILTAQLNDAIAITLPTPPDGGRVNLYVSAVNGTTLYLQDSSEVPRVVVVGSVRDDTRILTNALMHAPTVGSVVRTHGSQLAIADGKTVWVTAPMRPHLVDRRRGWFQYPAEVNALLSDSDLFVSADQCYAINSVEADDPGQRVVLEFPAISGTEVSLPDGRGAWMTKYGQAVTAKDTRGTSRMELVNREHYAPTTADHGAGTVLDHNGNQLLITTMRGQQGANPLAASDFFTGEVVRP